MTAYHNITISLLAAETPNNIFSEGHSSIPEAIAQAVTLKKGTVRLSVEENDTIYDFFIDPRYIKIETI